MTLSDAKKTAKEIIGSSLCFPYRNVWGFFNVGGYIGSSTMSEIEYAKENGKKVNYLEPVE